MSRPITGKQFTGERRVKRANGDIYVYERTMVYDQELHKTRTLSNKLIGKILAGTDEVVKTRARKPSKVSTDDTGEVKTTVASRQHVGTSQILDWVAEASHIDEDLHLAFPLGGDADKIASIARYLVATGGEILPRLESWQLTHPKPYEGKISEATYSNLFKAIGQNEDSVQRYFFARSSRLNTDDIIAFDSTTVSTYSSNQTEARPGHNKDGDELDAIKLLTLYSITSREPIAFSKQPGNISDVTTIKNTINQIKCLKVKNPLIVTDNGYYSEENVARFCQENIRFITLANKNVTWIKAEIDANRNEMDKMKNVCPSDVTTHGYSVTIQRDVWKKLPQHLENSPATLYLHIFYNKKKAHIEEIDFLGKILEIKQQLEIGAIEFNDYENTYINKYINMSNIDNKTKYTFNEENISKVLKYKGFFVVITNTEINTFEALRIYRLREKIEEMFGCYKGDLDGRRPRVWYPDNLRGRQFTQFIALSYRIYLTNKIDSVKKQLREYLKKFELLKEQANQNPDMTLRKLLAQNGMTVGDKKLRESLLRWLEDRSLQLILDWFDCVEETRVKTSSGESRWSTESTQRDRLFLSLLMGNATAES